MRLPVSSKAYDTEQTLVSPPGGGNMDRIPNALSFVKQRQMRRGIGIAVLQYIMDSRRKKYEERSLMC